MELAQKKDVENLIRAERSEPTGERRRSAGNCPSSALLPVAQDEGMFMTWLFSPPSLDDFIRLLKAWRFWSVGVLIGGLIGVAAYYIAPPPYHARATVVVDFNLEQAWPQNTDREQFYYLDRETRKLEEIAFSDTVMESITENNRLNTVTELRDEKLFLSQPADGGWHFYAEDNDPRHAEELASAWAAAFATQVTAQVASAQGLNSFIQVRVTQAANLPVERSVSLSTYLLTGVIGFLALASILVLFFDLG
jgi:capsular polysaccharide biosynthesis protein